MFVSSAAYLSFGFIADGGFMLVVGTFASRRRRRRAREILDRFSHELIIATEITSFVQHVDEGTVVAALVNPWAEVIRRLASEPDLLYDFAKFPRRFEELIAASYDRDGFRVTLTPRSGDLGRDIIAEKSGFGSLRILDQCKAFSKGNLVTPNDVRAVMGVLGRDQNASKAVITTSSSFAPSVREEWKKSIPYRLELRGKDDLISWLSQLDQRKIG